MYLSVAYDKSPTADQSWQILKARFWDAGHSFDEIRKMTMAEVALIVSYWVGKGRGEAKLRKQKSKLSSNTGKKKKRGF